jgi:hypothetical protein
MRRTGFFLFAWLLSCCWLNLKAQGTLQFNQAIVLSSSSNSNVLLGTVPANKVWKLVGYGTSADNYFVCNFSLDGSNAWIRTGSVYKNGTNYDYKVETSDLWLPAGSTVYALSCNYYRWINAIEFNIVP